MDKQSTKFDIFAGFAAIIIFMTYTACAILYTQHKAIQAAGESYTMQVCSQMANGSDYRRIKACGDAQKKYNLEYLCNGETANSGCWLEAK